MIGNAKDQFDEKGELVNETAIRLISELLHNLVDLVNYFQDK